MNYLRLYQFSLLLIIISPLIFGCSKHTTPIQLQSHDYNLKMLIDDLRSINSIEAVLEVSYEKDDTSLGGDMYIKADKNNMIVRVYYMGFLAGEIVEENGTIKSKVKMSKKRAEFLITSLRKSIFWWNFDFDEIIDFQERYLLKSEGREVVIDKKKMLPISQRITNDDGDAIDINYSEPLPIEPEKESLKPTDWYQSVVQIEYQKFRVNSKITSLKVLRD
ncbi:MAG TPA: hypothetical protein HPP56_09010 [Nitrospirae bacterium]|nr:hypothetical protein [Nitrospirota bacterium]